MTSNDKGSSSCLIYSYSDTNSDVLAARLVEKRRGPLESKIKVDASSINRPAVSFQPPQRNIGFSDTANDELSQAFDLSPGSRPPSTNRLSMPLSSGSYDSIRSELSENDGFVESIEDSLTKLETFYANFLNGGGGITPLPTVGGHHSNKHTSQPLGENPVILYVPREDGCLLKSATNGSPIAAPSTPAPALESVRGVSFAGGETLESLGDAAVVVAGNVALESAGDADAASLESARDAAAAAAAAGCKAVESVSNTDLLELVVKQEPERVVDVANHQTISFMDRLSTLFRESPTPSPAAVIEPPELILAGPTPTLPPASDFTNDLESEEDEHRELTNKKCQGFDQNYDGCNKPIEEKSSSSSSQSRSALLKSSSLPMGPGSDIPISSYTGLFQQTIQQFCCSAKPHDDGLILEEAASASESQPEQDAAGKNSTTTFETVISVNEYGNGAVEHAKRPAIKETSKSTNNSNDKHVQRRVIGPGPNKKKDKVLAENDHAREIEDERDDKLPNISDGSRKKTNTKKVRDNSTMGKTEGSHSNKKNNNRKKPSRKIFPKEMKSKEESMRIDKKPVSGKRQEQDKISRNCVRKIDDERDDELPNRSEGSRRKTNIKTDRDRTTIEKREGCQGDNKNNRTTASRKIFPKEMMVIEKKPVAGNRQVQGKLSRNKQQQQLQQQHNPKQKPPFELYVPESSSRRKSNSSISWSFRHHWSEEETKAVTETKKAQARFHRHQLHFISSTNNDKAVNLE